MLENWQDYKERLLSYGYTEEELPFIKQAREEYEHCPFEMFKELVSQGHIIRTAKTKKPRNVFTNGIDFVYLNHFNKRFEVCGKFKNEEI